MSQFIIFNVGGTIFKTTVDTIYADRSLDGNCLVDMYKNEIARLRLIRSPIGHTMEIFIDRSPTYFGYLLDHLRRNYDVIISTIIHTSQGSTIL
jgi:hypothetical protein